jgi:TolB protein
MGDRIEMQQTAGTDLHGDEDVQDSETGGNDGEEVTGDNGFRLIADERGPDAGYAACRRGRRMGGTSYTPRIGTSRFIFGLLDLQTGEKLALTSGNSINVELEWSPDGSKIAYVSTWPNGNCNIYVMPLSSGVPGAPVQLTKDFELIPPTVYYGKWALHIHPTWTRYGKELILISNRDNKHGSGGFYRMRAEPNAPLNRFRYEETTWKARPTLSPDGAKLVYSSYLGRQWQQLWAMPPKGWDAFPLTYGEFDRTTPRWSPDGTRIASISNETGDTALWLWHWFGGRMEQVKLERLVYKRAMAKLHVRVVDPATNKPVRAQVHLTASDERAYAPTESWFRADSLMFDHMDQAGEYHYFHADGDFEVDLPPGKTTLAFSKGFEYAPVQKEITVAANQRRAAEAGQ